MAIDTDLPFRRNSQEHYYSWMNVKQVTPHTKYGIPPLGFPKDAVCGIYRSRKPDEEGQEDNDLHRDPVGRIG